MHGFEPTVDASGHPGEPGADDLTDAAGITVPVDGHTDVYAATDDLDGDGHAESVVVGGGAPGATDGGYAYSDTTGDGVADTLTQYDVHGEVLAQAVHDPTTGQWREVEPGSVDVTGTTDPDGPLVVDTPDGPEVVGRATVDTDGDGVLDTVVTQTGDGATVLVTDVDGDRSADVVTEVRSDGGYATYARTGDGEWTETDRGSLSDTAPDAPDEPAPPVTTDPATGQWV